MSRKKLPIGIQTFSQIREYGYYYVDKTPHIERLINEGKHYFLSRPRRFGQSLLIDTLAELFEANEPLFEGLHIHHRWDWCVRYPVIRISFGGGLLGSGPELKGKILYLLGVNQERLGVTCPQELCANECFAELLRRCHERYGQRDLSLCGAEMRIIAFIDAEGRLQGDPLACRPSRNTSTINGCPGSGPPRG